MIKDKRIGQQMPDGHLRWPEQMADGRDFYWKNMPEATRLDVGEQGHFIVLSTGKYTVSPELWAEFLALVQSDTSFVAVPAVTTPVSSTADVAVPTVDGEASAAAPTVKPKRSSAGQ